MSKPIKWAAGAESISTGADATSLVFTLKPTTRSVAISYVWTGTTTGVVIPSISVDGTNFSTLADATGTANYGEAAPAGSASSVVKMVNLVANHLRIFYDRTSGTGLLSVTVKEV